MPSINGISTQEGSRAPVRRTVPRPDGVRTPAEFVAVMRDLQRWSGLTLQELEARTAIAPVLFPGGLVSLLGGSSLPRRELVSAFISACGCVPEVQAEWMLAHARVESANADPGTPDKPAAVLESPVPPSPEQAQPEEQPRQHRPRHRKSPPRRVHSRKERSPKRDHPRPVEQAAGPDHSRGRRPLTPLVAAPAFITVAVIGAAMLNGLADDDSGGKENKHKGQLSASAPPSTGWYSIQPESAASVGNCLTVLPDDEFKPTLSQDKCDDEDRLQRFRLEARSNGTYVVQANTNEDRLWCLTLDAPKDGSLLHPSACDNKNELQRFNLETAKPEGQTAARNGTSQPAPLFNLLSAETRQSGMCVGIDSLHSGTVQAVHTTCAKTSIWGYTFVPTTPPAGN
jgi:hypothetical protein